MRSSQATAGSGIRILWLGEGGSDDPALVGGKAASLSSLAGEFAVPPGFCLSAALLDGTALPTPDGELARAYAELARRSGVSEPAVAVRSSAVDEDGADASFAGQHESYLNLIGLERVAAAVSDCLASFVSSRALEYRRAHGLAAIQGRAAVLVQRLVPADVSAVVFSANPVTGDRAEIVINSSWGLGESVVGGTVTPDTYVLRRSDLSISDRRVADKRLMTIGVPGGTREVPVPGRAKNLPSLRDDQARDAARLALELEDATGRPVDLECAWAGEELHLLQCRPITTLTDDKEPARP
jgi:pyruvate,water dikinase